MTVKTISAIAVRVVGWLVILSGARSFLYSVLLVMVNTAMSAASSSSSARMASYPLLSSGLMGMVELAVGFALILNSQFFGQLLCKGIEEEH